MADSFMDKMRKRREALSGGDPTGGQSMRREEARRNTAEVRRETSPGVAEDAKEHSKGH